MRPFFGVSRSECCDYAKRIGELEKECGSGREAERKQRRCYRTRGYQRMHLWLGSQGTHQFRADKPDGKWVTDIAYIQTKEGVLSLSMIRDLYDSSIAARKTTTQQTAHLVLDTIRLAMRKEKERVPAELQRHSDQGFQCAKGMIS